MPTFEIQFDESQLQAFHDALAKVGPEGTKRLLKKMVVLGETRAKKLTPVDTGILRGSVKTDMDSAAMPQWASWLTNTKYAPYVEFGTKPHFPPVGALEGWAKRHNTSAFIVARAIARHGTKPHLMFTMAAEDVAKAAPGMVTEVEKELRAEVWP